MKAYAITGPTASGKTGLSIKVAREIGAEIISLDSMQIYKYMDIGTAKATPEEQAEVPHHLIDILLPSESFSTEDYKERALSTIEDITARGRIPLLVGGTGLYLDTRMRGSSEQVPKSDPTYRDRILNQTGNDPRLIWEMLLRVDPESANVIHENNVRRVIRALEIFEATGKPKSYFDRLSKEAPPPVNINHLTLDFHSRDTLYSRVDRRVDAMIGQGLIDETKRLLSLGYLEPGTTAAQAIGYKELLTYIRGENGLSDALELLKMSSRRYAKRQLTWFRHTDAKRVYVDREDGSEKSGGELLSEALDVFGFR